MTITNCLIFLLGVAVGVIVIMLSKKSDETIGKLKIVWDRVEHQPYMFMELNNPDITDITSRKYVTLEVDEDIEFAQK